MPFRAPFKEVEASRPEFDADAEVKYTRISKPDWKVGDGLNDLPNAFDFAPDNAVWRSIDPTAYEKSAMYKLMISGVTPRPIAFLSTTSADGVCNLAPMSYFNMVASNPPTIMVSIAASATGAGGLKDTSRNILATQEFCCSIISEPFVEAANVTGVDLPEGIEEWALSGLTKRGSEVVKPPYVAESAFSMECTLDYCHIVKTDEGKVTSHVVFGRVRKFHVKECVMDPKDPMRVMTEKLRPVCRLGGVTYGRVLGMAEMLRPDWAAIKESDEVRAAFDKVSVASM